MTRINTITALFFDDPGRFAGRFAFEYESAMPPEFVSLPSGDVYKRGGPRSDRARWSYTIVKDVHGQNITSVTKIKLESRTKSVR